MYCLNVNRGVELPLFLVYFSVMLGEPVNTNFILYRTCNVILHYNETECAKLGSNDADNATKELGEEVEPHANTIIMTIALLSQIIPAILCLFIGAWSDRNGRRVILLVSMSGTFFVYLVKVVVSLIPTASPWILLVECVPAILSGGLSTFLMISLCCIADTSTPENRAIRMAIFEGLKALGILAGTFLSSYAFEGTGYTGTFAISSSCTLIAWIYTLLFVKETLNKVTEIQENPSIFSSKYIKDMFHSTFRRRKHYIRSILLLAIASLVLFNLTVNIGSITMQYLYLKFGWTLHKYTLYSTAETVLRIVGTCVGIFVLHKLWSISEIALTLLSFITLCISNIWQGVAVNDIEIYIAAAITLFGALVSPMLRSFISKIVDSEDIGKIFALTVSLESLVGILGSPIYTLVYNATISTFSGTFCFVSAADYLICTLMMTVLLLLKKRERNSTICEVLVDAQYD